MVRKNVVGSCGPTDSVDRSADGLIPSHPQTPRLHEALFVGSGFPAQPALNLVSLLYLKFRPWIKNPSDTNDRMVSSPR